jgi:hypothetical protein
MLLHLQVFYRSTRCGTFALSSVSMPMKGSPHAIAAAPTEPVPMKGSTTTYSDG